MQIGFRQAATEASGPTFMHRKNKKDVGDCLQRLLKLRKDEAEKQKGQPRYESTGLEIIMCETWLNRSFAECHGLQGLLQADIVNFNLTIDRTWEEPSAYGYLQLGISDIMHVLIAQHLGCQYVASFDSDFQRAAEIIAEETGMRVLGNPKEILAIL